MPSKTTMHSQISLEQNFSCWKFELLLRVGWWVLQRYMQQIINFIKFQLVSLSTMCMFTTPLGMINYQMLFLHFGLP